MEPYMHDAAQPLQRVSVGYYVAPKQPQGGEFWPIKARPVFEFYAELHGAIIAAADNPAHACRVATTANVFEQESVIEIGHRGRGKAEFPAQPHAQQTTA
jgi:hypothetical protein